MSGFSVWGTYWPSAPDQLTGLFLTKKQAEQYAWYQGGQEVVELELQRPAEGVAS